MPGLDGTGPRGEGPKTGRGLGKCNGQENERISRPVRRGQRRRVRRGQSMG